MPFDIFTPDVGLKDDYDGTITSACFVQGDNAGWSLQIVITADDGDELTPKFSLGAKSGFTSYDGGESVQGPTKTSKIKESCSLWKFLVKCGQAGAMDEMKTRSDTLYDERGPLHADFWVGLKFHFDVIMDKAARRPDEVTGEWGPVKDEFGTVVGAPVSIPTKYLGVSGMITSAPNLFDAKDLEKLKEAALYYVDFASFAQAVLEMEDSEGKPMAKNRTVVSKLNQKFYEELRS